MVKMIKDKIVKTYFDYRRTLLDNYENPENFNVVIKIRPEKFFNLVGELSKECIYIERDMEAKCHFIELAGRKTPVIIDDNLPNNTEFIHTTHRQ